MRRDRLLSIGLLLLAAVILVIAMRRLWTPRDPEPAARRSSAYTIIAAPFPAGGLRGRLVVGSAAIARLSSGVEPPPPADLGCAARPWVVGTALLDAVVSIDGVGGGIAPADPEPEPRLTECGFEPRVSVGLSGAVARVKASGEHRVQGWAGGVRVFDAAKEGNARVTLLSEGPLQVRCASGHPWEQGWMHASQNPYQSVTDGKGRFRLEHVPAGKWTIRAWHPVLGETTREIEVAPSETMELDWRW